MGKTTRSLIKHRQEPTVYAIESDEDALILAALDVTREATSGGLCSHTLGDLPLAGRIDDVELLNRERENYDGFIPECGNVHHLMTELLALDREHRQAAAAASIAEARFRSLRKDVDAKSQKVHELLARINERKPLPLFEGIGG